MECLKQHPEGTLVEVSVRPGAPEGRVVGERAGRLRVEVAALPDRGRANVALTRLLADVAGLKRRQVELVSGRTSRRKRVLLKGLDLDSARARLSAVEG